VAQFFDRGGHVSLLEEAYAGEAAGAGAQTRWRVGGGDGAKREYRHAKRGCAGASKTVGSGGLDALVQGIRPLAEHWTEDGEVGATRGGARHVIRCVA
jgi:hypothetical protein